ncbi:MAG: dihydrofolate reductase family protein [Ilumatobacteraceae bacterium]
MANLIYLMHTSLDGYVEDADGSFDWSAPDEEVHSFVNELARTIGTYLFGRRMYETMVYWETAHTIPDQPQFALDFARDWKEADKIVYSKTLESVSSARTRIERSFDPQAVRVLKANATRDLAIEGPDLAGQAIKAGLVDEIHQIVIPVIVGGGKQFFPDGAKLKLDLVDERRFDSGFVYLRYRTRQN